MTDVLPAVAGTVQWIGLGAISGAQLLLIVLSLLIANAYGDRGLRIHAVAIAIGIACAFLQVLQPAFLHAALLILMALSALHVRELTSHVGSLRPLQRWMTGAAAALGVLAIVAGFTRWPWVPAAGAVLLLVLDSAVLPRAWPVSKPWAAWVIAGQGALLLAALTQVVPNLPRAGGLLLATLLAFWSMALYLASVWRSRVFGERRWQQAAARLEDPLTGLATPLVLGQRLQTARSLMRRYGHPSTLLLVHVDELQRIAEQGAAPQAEAAALEAGLRVRAALGPADLAARVGAFRFVVLSEGSSAAESASGLGSRILSAGLRETLHAIEGHFLHFRIAMAEVPVTDASGALLMQRLGECLDADVARRRNRRIRTLAANDLLNTEPVPLDDDSRISEWTTKTN